MRVVSSRVFEVILYGRSVRRVRSDVGLAIVDVWGAGATYDDGKDVFPSTKPLLTEGIGEAVYLSRINCAVLGEVVVSALFPLP
jgi:hypothetical protein